MWKIIPYEPRHREGVVAVVKSVFDEYRFTWEPDGYCSDLFNVEHVYLQPGGMFWCAVNPAGDVIGCAGVSFHYGYSELHRMYLRAECRGQGVGLALLRTCVDHARLKGSCAMRAWSDVQLKDAHRLYLKFGFVQNGKRICDDPDHSPEFGFWKEPL